MRKVSEMKVKDIIEMLNKHYKPEQNLFLMWWDDDCLQYSQLLDNIPKSDHASLWADIVAGLEQDEYMDETATTSVVRGIDFTIEAWMNES